MGLNSFEIFMLAFIFFKFSTFFATFNRFGKTLLSTHKFAIFQVHVRYIAITHAHGFIVAVIFALTLIHFTSFCQTDYGKGILLIWVLQKSILRELFVLDQISEDSIQFCDILRGVVNDLELTLGVTLLVIKHHLFDLGVQLAKWANQGVWSFKDHEKDEAAEDRQGNDCEY